MKKMTVKNKKLWLIIGAAVLVAVAAVAVALALFSGKEVNPGQLYWNVDGEYYVQLSGDGLSGRTPDSDGVFRMRFASEKGIEEFTTTDKKLVNMLDALFVVALEIGDNKEIVSAEDPSVLGYTVQKGLYVKTVSAGTITCNTSVLLSGMPVRVRISDDLQVLDVRADAENTGKRIRPDQLSALDYVYACFKDEQVYTHLFLAGRSPKSSIYWRASQQYNSTTKETTRVPDENGVYTVDFFSDGKYVELKCKDKAVVTSIDKTSRFLCHFALEFDEEGYITKTKLSSLGIKGAIGCSNYIVTAYDNGSLTATVMSGNEMGAEYMNELDSSCVIYDVSKTAKSEGRQGLPVDSLQVGDRIVLWTDADGFPVEAYITLRLAEVSPYFNMQRKWSSYYKRTTRVPDKEGYYYVELLKTGDSKPKTYKTKDQSLVDLIDSRGDRTVGIVADGDVLTTVYEAESIFGYTNIGPRYVSIANGSLFSVMTYKNENDVINGVYDMDCPIYDVSGTGPLGAKTSLRVGDLVVMHRDAALEIRQMYVLRREMGVDYAYYNLERQYDAQKKVTTRVPDEKGYYVFKMANKGKIVTVKTDSKALATQMDAFTPPVMGLIVKNGIVKYAFDPVNISGAVRVAYYSYVDKVAKDGTITATTSTGITSQFTPAESCTYYNCSQLFKTNRGEKVSGVKVGDLITGYLDRKGEAKVVYILSRETGDMAWNTQRKYNSATKETTRVADAAGYYNFQLLINGQVKTVRTKDRELANRIDSYDGAFGVYVEKGIIYNAMSVGLVKGIASKGVNGWDVVKLDGKKMTLRYTKPGSEEYTGKEQKVTLSEKLKVYDVSPTAKTYGAEVTLKLGDRIRTYLDDNGKVVYAYVLNHATRAAGTESYCAHCDQIVQWEPWTGAGFAQADRHYYMNCDVEKTIVLDSSGNIAKATPAVAAETAKEVKPFFTVLDLNGMTLKVNGSRCFTVNDGQTMTLMDSAGGGTLTSGGPVNGGTLSVQKGGVLNVQSGTIRGTVDDGFKGSVIYVVAGGTVNISGTAVIDGSGVTSGKGTGGAIYSNGTVNILGGEVKGGSVGSGGSVNIQGGVLNISGGKISGGQAANYGDDIFVNNPEATVTISGGEVSGQLQIMAAKTATLSGAPKLSNVKTASAVRLTLGNLQQGADIAVAAAGAFTVENNAAADYAKYFHGTDNTKQVVVYENVLYMEEKGTYVADCSHCTSAVIWRPWKAANTESGHYFLSGKVERTVRYAPEAADIVIDLYGQEWVTTDNSRAMLVNDGITVTIVDTVGTGIITAAGIEDGGVFSVKSGGTLNFNGGTAKVLSATDTLKGSVAYIMEGGTLNLGGGVLDASAIQNGKGACGAVYSSGTVNISGGEIKGGSVGSGGSVNVAAGSLTISGGKISGGQAANYGDDIFVNNPEATVTISGGEVSGQFHINQVKTVTVSGAPKLGNLKPAASVKLTLGELTEGTRIAVAAAGEFSVANEKAKDYLKAGYFTAVNNKDSVKVTENGILYVPTCPHCDKTVGSITWNDWDGVAGDRNTTGHYYLTDHYTQNGQVKLTGGDVVLDLAGYTLSTTTGRPFYVNGGTLSILDTSEGKTGLVTGKATASGGVLFINTNGTMHIYGGTFRSVATTGKDGGTVAINGNLTLHNGTIEGSTSTTAGGNIQLSKGSFTMEGGLLTAGTATTSGGTIFVKGGTLTLNGGTIESGTVGSGKSGTSVFAYRAAAATPCTVNIGSVNIPTAKANSVVIGGNVNLGISGAPKIGYMSINTTSQLTVEELVDGASVSLAITGSLPLANTNPQLATYLEKGYLKAYGANNKLVLEGNALKMVALQ